LSAPDFATLNPGYKIKTKKSGEVAMAGLYANDASIWESIGRLLIVFFFLTLGFMNATQPARVQDHVHRLLIFKAPFPTLTFWCGIVLQFASCAALLFNYYPAYGALGLVAFTVLASALLLRFWQAPDPMKWNMMFNGFMANIAITGGLLVLYAHLR
jgi:uncharacterized membrane protein YphA (DoxX/SURF4 family)